MIAEEPRNGYQIIQELERRTDGRWKPSPGAVYPALSQLEDEGLIRPTEDGKTYEVTDDGRTTASEVAQERSPWDLGPVEDHPESGVEAAHQQLSAAVSAIIAAGDADLAAKAIEELESARRSLYQLLADA